MPALIDANPITYNGYTFPLSVETTELSQVPYMDTANRAVLYVKFMVSLKWHVNADIGSNIDSTMADIRRVLMQRGGSFGYANRGLGADLIVDNTSHMTDVGGGPVPLHFTFKPKGKNQGATCNWTVELCLPTNCSAVATLNGKVMEFNWKLKERIDRHGYSTLTYTGLVTAPKIMTGPLQFDPTQADDFLERVIPEIPNGFIRADRDWDHSWDRKRLDFTVVDEQMTDRALPKACTQASASHYVRSTDRGLFHWQGVISGSYSVAQGYKPDVAWTEFYDLVKHRLDIARSALLGDPGAPAVVGQQKPKEQALLMITGYSFGEPDIYGVGGNNAAFEINYTAIHSLKAILGANEIVSGLYRFPHQGQAAYDRWINSVADVQGNVRGLNQTRMNPGNEIIIDLCSQASMNTPQSGNAIFTGDDNGIFQDILDLQPSPDVDTSWLMYEPEIEIYDEFHAVVSSSLTEETYKPYEGSPGDITAQGYVPDDKPSDPTDSVQYRAPSTLVIYISGSAVRAWFPIPRPKIVDFNGLQVKEVSTEEDGCYWMQKNVGSLGIGMPIYYARFRFKYIVEARPTEPIRPPTSLAEQN